MMIEGAIGDAYGAAFEFAGDLWTKHNNKLTQYRRHPLWNTQKGVYTDDTQMAIGIAELLIEGKDWTATHIASKFLEVFKRDVRVGYARRFFGFLQSIETGEEFLEKIIPTSIRNGAAMRAYPIGIVDTEVEVLERAAIQAAVTHNTQQGILSAQAIALMSHYLLYQKGDRAALGEYLNDWTKHQWNTNWKDKVEVDGMQTVEAVLTILMQEHTLKNMLKKSVDFGGDTDTVASLALAIGSVAVDVEKDLPQWTYDDLENEKYGRAYLETLDLQLLSLKSKL